MNVPTGSLLPGAIQAVVAEGHVEAVKLERLWSLTWHRGWKIPDKRPR